MKLADLSVNDLFTIDDNIVTNTVQYRVHKFDCMYAVCKQGNVERVHYINIGTDVTKVQFVTLGQAIDSMERTDKERAEELGVTLEDFNTFLMVQNAIDIEGDDDFYNEELENNDGYY